MTKLQDEVAGVVGERGFSGVVRVDRRGHPEVAHAYGLAERGFGVPNTLETQFAVASATKGLTVLTVVSLVSAGRLALDTTARSLLRDDLPEIRDEVTVEHLLAHRSGMGDFVYEDGGFDPTAYVMTLPVHQLSTAEGYLRALTGRPSAAATVSASGSTRAATPSCWRATTPGCPSAACTIAPPR
jgi:CubicO group peptidase (beta-lactamase class C family)